MHPSRLRKPLLSLALGVIALVGCDVFSSDKESFSPIPKATTIAPGQPANGRFKRLSGTSTTDTVKLTFAADSGKTYGFSINSKEGYVYSSSVWVLTPGGTRLDPPHSYASNVDDSLTLYCTKSGSYTLVFYTIASNFDWSVIMSAKEGLPSGIIGSDAYEFDDSRSLAKSISTDGTVQERTISGINADPDDIDWITIKCDSGNTYAIDYSVNTSYFGFELRVFDKDSNSLSYSESGERNGGAVHYHSFEVAKTDTFYIRAISNYASRYSIAVTARKGITASKIQDAYESDNTLSTAKTITGDSIWQDRTLHVGYSDADLIAFEADSGRTYRIQMTDPSGFANMTALNSDSTMATYQDSSSGSRKLLVIPVVKRGTCYVRVYSNTSSSTAYKVALTSSTGLPAWGMPETGEPDHGTSSAAAIATDSTALYRSITRNDTDWIRIPVSKGRIYSILIGNRSSSQDNTLSMVLTTANGAGIEYATVVGNEYWTSSYEAGSDGAIYMEIRRAYSPNTTTIIPYSIRVSSKAVPVDPLEPDSNVSCAPTLASDASSIGRWTRSGDDDWMKIQVESDRKINVYFDKKASSGNNLSYELYSRDNIKAASGNIDYAETGVMSYTPRYTGPMYVHVFSSSAKIVPYGIRVENYPKDVTEPDNDMKSAILIKADGSSSASLLSDGDEDWIKFAAKAGTAYRISWFADGNINTLLFDSDSTELNEYTYDDSGSILHRATKDDTLYVRALPYSFSTTTPFALRIAVAPVANDSDDPANNSLKGARLIATDSSVQRARIILDDEDNFFFQAESGTTYRISSSISTYPYGNQLLFQMLDSDSNAIVENFIGSSFMWKPTKNGKFFLRVQSDFGSSVVDYSLAIKAYKPDGYEKDDNQSSAKPITTDGTPQSRSLIGADEDWISVPVDSGVVYTLHVATDALLYDGIYTDDFLVLAEPSIISSQDSRTFTIGRKCNLFARISSFDSNTVTNYQIWITKQED